MAVRAFTYLLSPTVKQSHARAALLAAQRELYNAALEERRGAWRWERRLVTRFEQFGSLKDLHELRPDLMRFGVCAARGTLTRLDRAFRAFFRRVKAGQAPGSPRFKGPGRFDSVEYPDRSGWALDEGRGRLYLLGVGHVKLRLHRPLGGEARTCTVKREGRRWRVSVFCINVPARPLASTGRVVGIDLGVGESNLVATSDGDLVGGPRPGRALAERVTRVSRELDGRRKGSARRAKTAARLSALHRKEARIRRDWAHRLSRRLVDAYDLIAHEALPVANMVRRPRPKPDPSTPGGFLANRAAAKAGLNRSIHDAGWARLLSFIAYKAGDAGRQVIAVNPAHTSQRCFACGHVDAGNRRRSAFRCLGCGHEAHADVTAAHNVLRAGLARRLEREAGSAA